MIQGILLVIALSLDSFLAALAYAAKRIRIPFASAVVIASISACFLAFPFFFRSDRSADSRKGGFPLCGRSLCLSEPVFFFSKLDQASASPKPTRHMSSLRKYCRCNGYLSG